MAVKTHQNDFDENGAHLNSAKLEGYGLLINMGFCI